MQVKLHNALMNKQLYFLLSWFWKLKNNTKGFSYSLICKTELSVKKSENQLKH